MKSHFIVASLIASGVLLSGCAGHIPSGSDPTPVESHQEVVPTPAQSSSAATGSPTPSPLPTETIEPSFDGAPSRLFSGECDRLFTVEQLSAITGVDLAPNLDREDADRGLIGTQHGIACEWGDINTAGVLVRALPRAVDTHMDSKNCPGGYWPESNCRLQISDNRFTIDVIVVGADQFDAEPVTDNLVTHVWAALREEKRDASPIAATGWTKTQCRSIEALVEKEYATDVRTSWDEFRDSMGEGTYFDDEILRVAGLATCRMTSKSGGENVNVSIRPGQGWDVSPGDAHVAGCDAASVIDDDDYVRRSCAIGIHRIDVAADAPFDRDLIASLAAGVLRG